MKYDTSHTIPYASNAWSTAWRFGYIRIADVAIRRLDLASGTIVTCRPDDPDSPDLTRSQSPLPDPSRQCEVAAMTVQVGAALGLQKRPLQTKS